MKSRYLIALLAAGIRLIDVRGHFTRNLGKLAITSVLVSLMQGSQARDLERLTRQESHLVMLAAPAAGEQKTIGPGRGAPKDPEGPQPKP
jgi:hypothetical protein